MEAADNGRWVISADGEMKGTMELPLRQAKCQEIAGVFWETGEMMVNVYMCKRAFM